MSDLSKEALVPITAAVRDVERKIDAIVTDLANDQGGQRRAEKDLAGQLQTIATNQRNLTRAVSVICLRLDTIIEVLRDPARAALLAELAPLADVAADSQQ